MSQKPWAELARELSDLTAGDRFSLSLSLEPTLEVQGISIDTIALVEWGREGRMFRLTKSLGPHFMLLPKAAQGEALEQFVEGVKAHMSPNQKPEPLKSATNPNT